MNLFLSFINHCARIVIYHILFVTRQHLLSHKILLEANHLNIDSSEEALSEGSRSESEIYVASSSSDESVGEVDDEETLHECLLRYETMKK